MYVQGTRDMNYCFNLFSRFVLINGLFIARYGSWRRDRLQFFRSSSSKFPAFSCSLSFNMNLSWREGTSGAYLYFYFNILAIHHSPA